MYLHAGKTCVQGPFRHRLGVLIKPKWRARKTYTMDTPHPMLLFACVSTPSVHFRSCTVSWSSAVQSRSPQAFGVTIHGWISSNWSSEMAHHRERESNLTNPMEWANVGRIRSIPMRVQTGQNALEISAHVNAPKRIRRTLCVVRLLFRPLLVRPWWCRWSTQEKASASLVLSWSFRCVRPRCRRVRDL